MQQDKRDKVISGRFRGQYIVDLNGYAYISPINIWFRSDKVQEIKLIDSRGGSALTGAVLAGTEGAIVASNRKVHVIEVVWKTGEKSLINATPMMYEKILATTYKQSMDDKTLKEKETAKTQSDTNAQIGCAVIIFIFWLIGYFA